jgi:hypothetical protein
MAGLGKDRGLNFMEFKRGGICFVNFDKSPSTNNPKTTKLGRSRAGKICGRAILRGGISIFHEKN